MSDRLKYLSKDKEQRKQQLSLLIHNCNVYRISNDIRTYTNSDGTQAKYQEISKMCEC